jgi:predicted Ser/Thr protein kinase
MGMKPLGVTDPAVVASYRLLGVLGGGGMGKVYLGQSPTGRKVAIKVIRAELADDQVFRRRFAREVAAARSVSPLYTAAVVDADTEAAAPWLATTYIEGPSLEEWVVDEGPLSPAAVLMLAAGLAEALASIHRVGLVHRDLKPSNVLIDDTGPHIIDFGIALSPDDTRITTSLVVGTPSYMSPERLAGGEASAAGDVFSLGATLVYACSGRRLVNDDTVQAQVMQMIAGNFDLSAVPKTLRPLVVLCVSPRTQDRPTAQELVRILVASGVSAPVPGWHKTTEPPPVVQTPSRPRRTTRRRLLIAGGVAGVAAAGGAAYALGLLDRFTGGSPTAGGTTPTPAAATPTPTDVPGAVRWQAKSGTRPLGAVLGEGSEGERIVVYGGRWVIAVEGSQVRGFDVLGTDRWSRTMPGGLLQLRPWGDAVLVNDASSLWLLKPTTGETLFTLNPVPAEEDASRNDNPDDQPVQIGAVALAPSMAFLHLGTATVAIDRAGNQKWRIPRPAERDGRRPSSGSPLAADANWLVTHDTVDDEVTLGFFDAKSGRRKWSTTYTLAPPLDTGGGGPPPAGPPPSGQGGRPPGGGRDDAWYYTEGRITDRHLVLRDAHEVRVLRLSDGRAVWNKASRTPVVAIELVGDMVVVAADALSGYGVANSALLWQEPLRGARVALTSDGQGIVTANEQGLRAYRNRRMDWRTDLPSTVQQAMPDRLFVDEDTAFLTFRPRDEQRLLDVDVVAFTLDS